MSAALLLPLLLLQSAPASQAAPGAHLLVLCAVDQLPADYLVRFAPGFTEDGFRRVQRDGVECVNAGYDYAFTETGPGHATLGTGARPHRHGIVSNDWLDRTTLKSVYCVDGVKGQSARHLLGETLGDRIKLTFGPRSTVVSASIKDRSAILLGGRLADGVFWYDRAKGDFVSSPEFRGDATLGPRAQELVAGFNRADPRPIDTWRGQTWSRLLDPGDPRWVPLYAILPPDDSPFERPPTGFGRTFDHVLPAGETAYHYRLYDTPFANQALLDLATRLLDDPALALGRRAGLDLLCLSFSATDPIGHAFGAHSHEVLDAMVRLDRQLAQLFQTLDRTVGAGRWTLALSADHGATPVPEYLESLGAPAGRVDFLHPGGVLEHVANALVQRFQERLPATFLPLLGAGNDRGRALLRSPFGAFRGTTFYLASTFLNAQGIPLQAAAELVRDVVAREPGVAEAITASDLQMGRFAPESLAAAMRLSFRPERSGDVLFCLAPGFVAGAAGDGFAATHGSPWSEDQRVPVLFLGAGFGRGRRVTQKVSPADLVPTLCARFGLVPPSISEGRVVSEAFAQ